MAKELRVKWVGDDSQFSGTADRVENKLGGFHGALTGLASRSSSAWSTFSSSAGNAGLPLGPLAGALDHVVGSLDHVAEHGLKAGSALAAGGALAAGLGGIGLKAAKPLERAREQLKTVVENAGGEFSAVEKQLGPLDHRMEHFGHTNADTTEALLKLVPAVKDPNEAIKEMSIVSEIASFKHISLSDAAGLVAKVHGGATRVLKEFGVNLKDVTSADSAHETASKSLATAEAAATKIREQLSTKTKVTAADHLRLREAEDKVHAAQKLVADTATAAAKAHEAAGLKGKGYADVLGLVHEKIKGVDQAQADTFGGKLEAAKAKITDIAATLGEKFGKTLIMVGPAISGVGAIMQIFGTTSAAAGAEGAAGGVAFSLGWLPVILLIAALGVGIYELATHWSAVWGFITDIASTAFGWIKDHILLIGSILLGGPIGLGLYMLVTHWSAVWGAIKTVLSTAWGFISGIFRSITGGIGDVIDFFVKLPGRILDAVKGFGSLLLHAGEDLIKGLIKGIENMGSAILKKLEGLGGGIIGKVMGIFGSHSPSLVFHDIGVGLMQGLANGITAGAPGAHDALDRATGVMAATSLAPAGAGSFAPRRLPPEAGDYTGSSVGRSAGGIAAMHLHMAPGAIVVQGNVITEGDLVDSVHRGFLDKLRRDGNLRLLTGLPG